MKRQICPVCKNVPVTCDACGRPLANGWICGLAHYCSNGCRSHSKGRFIKISETKEDQNEEEEMPVQHRVEVLNNLIAEMQGGKQNVWKKEDT